MGGIHAARYVRLGNPGIWNHSPHLGLPTSSFTTCWNAASPGATVNHHHQGAPPCILGSCKCRNTLGRILGGFLFGQQWGLSQERCQGSHAPHAPPSPRRDNVPQSAKAPSSEINYRTIEHLKKEMSMLHIFYLVILNLARY